MFYFLDDHGTCVHQDPIYLQDDHRLHEQLTYVCFQITDNQRQCARQGNHQLHQQQQDHLHIQSNHQSTERNQQNNVDNDKQYVIVDIEGRCKWV